MKVKNTYVTVLYFNTYNIKNITFVLFSYFFGICHYEQIKGKDFIKFFKKTLPQEVHGFTFNM